MCYRNLFKVDKDLYYVIMRSIKRSVNNRWTVFGKIKRLWSVRNEQWRFGLRVGLRHVQTEKLCKIT